jgi:iron complex transport system substrate-binding protein
MTLQTERLIATNPCRVIYSAAQPGDVARLRAAGIPLSHLPTESVADVTSAILEVGRLLGRENRAQDLVVRIKRDLAVLADQVTSHGLGIRGELPKVLLVLSRRPGAPARSILTAGPGTYLDDLLRVAGGRNVASGSRMLYPTLGTEALLTTDRPDVIVELLDGESDGSRTVVRDGAQARRDAEAAWAALYGRERMPRVEVLQGSGFLIPGPRIVLTARRLAKAINPGLALPEEPEDPTLVPQE